MTHHELIRRQQQLLTRSTELRAALRTESQSLAQPLAVMDKAQQGIRWVLEHPQWPLGVAVALLVLKPRRVLAWSSRIWWAWKTVKRLQTLINN